MLVWVKLNDIEFFRTHLESYFIIIKLTKHKYNIRYTVHQSQYWDLLVAKAAVKL